MKSIEFVRMMEICEDEIVEIDQLSSMRRMMADKAR
jgi:hypothetical protein